VHGPDPGVLEPDEEVLDVLLHPFCGCIIECETPAVCNRGGGEFLLELVGNPRGDARSDLEGDEFVGGGGVLFDESVPVYDAEDDCADCAYCDEGLQDARYFQAGPR